jgi:hypothetical protein
MRTNVLRKTKCLVPCPGIGPKKELELVLIFCDIRIQWVSLKKKTCPTLVRNPLIKRYNGHCPSIQGENFTKNFDITNMKKKKHCELQIVFSSPLSPKPK